MVVLEDPCERRRHERLAEADDIAYEDAAALVEMVGGDLHRRGLEIEEAVSEVLRYAELADPGPRIAGEMVGHLQVHMVRGERLLPRPALVYDVRELLRDVHAPAVIPAILEPLGQLAGGVVVENIHVQLALVSEAGRGEIGASNETDRWQVRVVAVDQIELRVQRAIQIQAHAQLSGPELMR